MIYEISNILMISTTQSTPVADQGTLDKFVRAFEKEGHIDAKDLLGGQVLFESEFKKPKHQAYAEAKDYILEKVRRENRPQTLQVYPEPGKKDKIYVVFPDSYAPYILNKSCKFTIKVVLFHEFVHVRDSSAYELLERFNNLLSSKKTFIHEELLRSMANILPELKANFQTRDFIKRAKGKFDACPIKSNPDEHLIAATKEVEDQLLGILLVYPQASDAIEKVCREYISEEFKKVSSQAQAEINRVLEREEFSPIK